MDLNSLNIFFALYQEKNMRRTADRLHSSQPALSQKLSKLRHHFKDELFVKVPSGLEPTPFADDLYQNAYDNYYQLLQAIEHTKEFDPSKVNRTIQIAVSPFLAPILGSRFVEKIRSKAPMLKIFVIQWNQQTIELIKSDQIQLGISYQIVSKDKQIREKFVAKDSFSCLVRKDHPMNGTVVSMDTAANYPFTTIISSDWNTKSSYAEQAFATKGLSIDVQYRSEFPANILDIVQKSDMIFPCSKLYRFTNPNIFRSIEIEGEFPFVQPNICFYHHYKNDKDPLNLWLMKMLDEVLNSP